MLLDYLLPIFQDSICTDKVRAVNHYLGKFQSQGNSQSEQLFVIYGVLESFKSRLDVPVGVPLGVARVTEV